MRNSAKYFYSRNFFSIELEYAKNLKRGIIYQFFLKHQAFHHICKLFFTVEFTVNAFNSFKFVIQIDQVGSPILLSCFLSILSELHQFLLHLGYLLGVIVCIDLLFSICYTDSRENIGIPTELLLWLG